MCLLLSIAVEALEADEIACDSDSKLPLYSDSCSLIRKTVLSFKRLYRLTSVIRTVDAADVTI